MSYATVRITLPWDHLVAAVEGAYVRYWGALMRVRERATEPMCWTVKVKGALDIERNYAATINRDTLERGLEWLATHNYTEAFGRIVAGKADGTDGDLLVQAAAFGEIVYA